MDVTSQKGAVIVIIFVITMVPQLIPLCLVRMRNGRLVFSARGQLVFDYLSCFAGGAFLGTCLLHLLAEGLEEFENYKQHVGLDLDFPLYETIVGAGVFLIAFVEKLGHALQVKRSHSPAKGQASDSVNGAVHTIAYKPSTSEEAVTRVHEPMKVCGWVGQGQPSVFNDSEVGEQVSAVEGNGELATGSPCRSHGVKVVNQVQEVKQLAGLRAAVLMAALSFHTVFDGLAIGLQESAQDVWAVSTAISVHKALVAFCLGLELSSALRHASLRRPLLAMMAFSLVAPVGVGVGMIVTSSHLHETAEMLTSSILQALATGTFLYVTFMEILAQHLSHLHTHDPDESHGHGHDFLKIAVAAVGFGAMAGIKVMDKD